MSKLYIRVNGKVVLQTEIPQKTRMLMLKPNALISKPNWEINFILAQFDHNDPNIELLMYRLNFSFLAITTMSRRFKYVEAILTYKNLLEFARYCFKSCLSRVVKTQL